MVLSAACEAPSVIRATPPATTKELVTPTVAVAGSPTAVPAPAPVVGGQIERIAFATRVDRNGEPAEETSVFPETPEQMYLCVQVRDVELGTQFRAYWFADGQIIGQSDALATRADDVVWVTLGYRPIAALSPTSEHSVELQIDTQTVDRFVFRVGVGDAEDVVAQAAFASGFDAAGKPVDEQHVFAEDASELRLLARMSRQVDTAGMLFTSIWYRGETAIAYINPERVSVDDTTAATPSPTPILPLPRVSTVLEFAYAPTGPLPRGNYRVSLLLNGTEVRSVPFEIGDAAAVKESGDDGRGGEDESDDEEAPDASGLPTIGQLVVTAEIDDETNEPVAVNIWVWEGRARSRQELFATFSVNDLDGGDDVRVTIERDGETFDTIEIEHVGLDAGWLAAAFDITLPSQAGRMYSYTVTIEINGENVAERSFEVWGVNS